MYNQSIMHSIVAIHAFIENDLGCIMTYLSVSVFVFFTDKAILSSYIVFAISFYSILCSNLGYFLSRVKLFK